MEGPSVSAGNLEDGMKEKGGSKASFVFSDEREKKADSIL